MPAQDRFQSFVCNQRYVFDEQDLIEFDSIDNYGNKNPTNDHGSTALHFSRF